MPSLFSAWMLPASPQTCAAKHHNVTCNFSLYSNASNLQEQQKLAPAVEFTGKAIVSAFMASSIMAIILSLSLLVDRCKWHFWENKHSEKASTHRYLYLRLIYIVEKLLHTLSDQQLIAGFALLALLNRKACEVSAYHFSLACTLLLLSAVTHLSPLFTIHDYVYKGRTIAFFRIAAIVVQYVMSVKALSARNSKSFPAKASSLAIMPAACFENMNASNNLGLDDFFKTAANMSDIASNITSAVNSNSTFNATDTWHNIQAAVAPSQGYWEYLTLVVLLGFAASFLLAEWWHTQSHPEALKHKTFGWAGMIFSAISILVSIIVVGIVMNNYYDLRAKMEVDRWFQSKAAALQSPSYSNFLIILLVSSGSLATAQAICESLAGHKGRRFVQAVRREVADVWRWEKAAEKSSDDMEMKDGLTRNTGYP